MGAIREFNEAFEDATTLVERNSPDANSRRATELKIYIEGNLVDTLRVKSGYSIIFREAEEGTDNYLSVDVGNRCDEQEFYTYSW